jgi:DNA repair exonuclease SbcCD ATPase subunit
VDSSFILIVIILTTALIVLPVAAWIALRKLSSVDKVQQQNEELHSLENSLSFMIKELQESVKFALSDMDEAAAKLNEMIELADDRLRQLQYYYEYGEELKPLVEQGPGEPAATPPPKNHALKHREVYELSRKGWSVAQIARHTGMSADEVQLIVNLMEISTLGPHFPTQQTRNPLV